MVEGKVRITTGDSITTRSLVINLIAIEYETIINNNNA